MPKSPKVAFSDLARLISPKIQLRHGSWIDNNSLIYGDTVDNKTAIFYLNHEKVLLEQTLVPDVYVSSENIVFTLGSNKRHEFNLGSAETMSTSFSYAPYDYSDFTKQKLSPDGKEIVMGVQGPASFYGTGIHILTIETNEWRRLR